jgi:hypothetical protein
LFLYATNCVRYLVKQKQTYKITLQLCKLATQIIYQLYVYKKRSRITQHQWCATDK